MRRQGLIYSIPLFRSLRSHRGQTFLEYVMLLMVVAIPLAAAVRSVLEDKDDKDKKNIVYSVVKDAYGDHSRMGVIGRPYP